MGNPDTLVALATQDTGQRLEKTQGKSRVGNPESLVTLATQDRGQKVRENPRANQEWAIQRHW
jgi:hypothetical protein